jgi:hypothetical protein
MPRKKDWPSNKKKISESAFVQLDNQGNVTGIKSEVELAKAMQWVYQWARDMHGWGQDVRDDILRLEGHAGFASGDPGDPPDPPPNGDE